jgi:hypothetical protein
MKLEVPSKAMANAWQAAMICAGDDEELPQLDHTIWLEVFEGHGIRMVSTNTFVFLNAWVPFSRRGVGRPPAVNCRRGSL